MRIPIRPSRVWRTALAALGTLALLAAVPSARAGEARAGDVRVGDDSPVADAAERGDAEAVRALLRGGADPNEPQADGLTALHWAALNDDAELVGVLAYAGAALDPLTRVGGYTPLHLASRRGHEAAARALLDAGADPARYTTTGVAALHFAAEADAVGVVEALLARGADVDAPDAFSGRTPAMFAAVRNAGRALRALVAAGADLSLATDVKDYVAIEKGDRAERERRQRMRKAAEEPEPEEEDEPGREPSGGAPEREPSAAEPEPKAGPRQPTLPDSTPREPAERGAVVEPEEPDEPTQPPPPFQALSSIEQIGKQGGFTALHYAAREGHAEAARILLDAGADIDQRTEGDRSSPLLVSVINGNYDLAMELLARGADANLVSDDGAGPLFATLNIEWSLRTWYPQPGMFRRQEISYLELMRRLLEAGADPNQRLTTHIWYAAYNAGRMGVDFTGATPFWRAAYAADVEAMRLLVEHGADPDVWTVKLPQQRRRFPGQREREEPEDKSGLPPVPVGGPAVHPLHAATGVGFGTSRVAQQHRHVPGGWLPAVRYLVDELGVDPNLRDADGYTAVHHAAARGDRETILYLVEKGADVHAVSRRGQTTADLANSPEQRAQPHPAAVALLEKLGSKNSHRCQSCGAGGG